MYVEPPSIDMDEYTPTEPDGDDPGKDLLVAGDGAADEGPGEVGQAADDAASVKKSRAALEAWQQKVEVHHVLPALARICLLYTSPSPRDA